MITIADLLTPKPCKSRVFEKKPPPLPPPKKKMGSGSISFLAHPGRSPGMMLLCLSTSRIYNTVSILIRTQKKNWLLFYILFGSPT